MVGQSAAGRNSKWINEQFLNGRTPEYFGGMGLFRGRREYSPAEEIVLDYFFTNTKSNVYAAKDTLPGQLWSLMMGQYARAAGPARDRLLEVFKDTHKKDASALSVDQFAEAIVSRGDVSGLLQAQFDRANKFIEEWGHNYGHV